MLNTLFSSLFNRGFVIFDNPVFSESDHSRLLNLRSILSSSDPQYSSYQINDPGFKGLRRVIELDDQILDYVTSILKHNLTQSVLEHCVGSDYQIWDVVYRVSHAPDNGLDLHQDTPGQLNLVIPLSSNSSISGQTVYFQGSHLLPFRLPSGWTVPRRLLHVLVYFGLLHTLPASPNQLIFFFNKVWHGRCAASTNSFTESIFISFFPSCIDLDFSPPYKKLSFTHTLTDSSFIESHVSTFPRESSVFSLFIERIHFLPIHTFISSLPLLLTAFLKRYISRLIHFRSNGF